MYTPSLDIREIIQLADHMRRLGQSEKARRRFSHTQLCSLGQAIHTVAQDLSSWLRRVEPEVHF